MRPNSKLLKSTMTGALGGLLFGFDLVLVSGIIDSIVRLYGLSDYQKGITVAMGPLSTVIGCFVAGVIGQRLGTRTAMRWAAAVYLLATLGTALSVGWPMLLAMRFMAGLGLGSATVLCPVYISELSPALWRGRLVGMFQINVVTGILVGYTSNYFVRLAHLGAIEWRVMVGVVLVPTSLFLLALFTIPRSPRWSASPFRALCLAAGSASMRWWSRFLPRLDRPLPQPFWQLPPGPICSSSTCRRVCLRFG